MILAAYGLHFANAGAMIVHRLPHAAGMRQGGGDRQPNGTKIPESRNTSSNLAVRRYMVVANAGTSIGDAGPRASISTSNRVETAPSAVGSRAARRAQQASKSGALLPDSGGGSRLQRPLGHLLHQDPTPATSEHDNEVHHH